ncbi:MAG: aminomethyl-transferring glycine dehydrogenase subunit GcvPB [candidate division Zixibacteria bacterium]|nr:aminomethyl-transferring glycine dehydrogenase subunit GcvPB [candidate division Zixibacteria bacterium]
MNPVVEPTIFELSSPGRKGVPLPQTDVPEPEALSQEFRRRSELAWPEAAEIDVMRHFVRLSVLNHHIEKGIYPLGSCTMKYNPKVNEQAARLPGFAELHPETAEADAQGALKLMYELAGFLAEIGGVGAVTLQPSAGAQGELAGLLLMKAHHSERKDKKRNQIIIPDSAHGTNPASVATAGWETVQIASGADGRVSLKKLQEALTGRTAGMMLTNPNTLGLFEKDILEICRLVHEAGGLMYMDGANLNALMGIVKPGDLGFDIVHFNLHKTFSTPHGGGGPGAGAVGVKKFLEPYLPNPRVERIEKKGKDWYRFTENKKSIGKVHSAFGNFGVLVRAYTYIRTLGTEGLSEVSENAILNANYLLARVKDSYEVPYPGFCQHEFVLSGNRQKAQGVRTMDIAKRLLDFGVHAPTAYFPLIVPEALMIEPTETESRESLDYLADAFIQIAREVETDPEKVKKAPHTTPVGRLDEAKAARDLDIAFHK